MVKNIKISNKLLKIVNLEAFQALTNLFGKNINNYKEIFNIVRNNVNYRSQVFDLMNMLPVLNYINYEVKKKLEKKIINKTLLNWTYPQIRFDDISSKKYSAPAHKDRWVIDRDKKGYIVWIPLLKEGASLLIAKSDRTKKIIKNNYWGLEAVGPSKFTKKKIKFGEALLFDADTLHKSSNAKKPRITLQLRYEEISKKNFKKSVIQKINPDVLKYWKKNLIYKSK